MVMKILILIFYLNIDAGNITRGHDFMLMQEQSRLDVRQDHTCMEYIIY